MADVKKIDFVPSDWGPKIEGWLHSIDGIERHIETMRERIQSGEYQALAIDVDGANVGSMVWSVENEPSGAIIIVNALASKAVRGVDVTKLALAFAARVGRAVDAVGIRFWTQRRGLVRKAQAHGYQKSYVMEGKL